MGVYTITLRQSQYYFTLFFVKGKGRGAGPHPQQKRSDLFHRFHTVHDLNHDPRRKDEPVGERPASRDVADLTLAVLELFEGFFLLFVNTAARAALARSFSRTITE